MDVIVRVCVDACDDSSLVSLINKFSRSGSQEADLTSLVRLHATPGDKLYPPVKTSDLILPALIIIRAGSKNLPLLVHE